MDFSFDNDRPVYLQLVEQLRASIVSGAFAPGQRLPSVRDLSAEAKVNPNTMMKALTQLESEGLVFTERTNGKFVTSDLVLLGRLKTETARALTLDYLSRLRELGLTAADGIDQLKSLGGDGECL